MFDEVMKRWCFAPKHHFWSGCAVCVSIAFLVITQEMLLLLLGPFCFLITAFLPCITSLPLTLRVSGEEHPNEIS